MRKVLAQNLFDMVTKDISLYDERGEYIFSGHVTSVTANNGRGGDLRDGGPYKFYRINMYNPDEDQVRYDLEFPLDCELQVEPLAVEIEVRKLGELVGRNIEFFEEDNSICKGEFLTATYFSEKPEKNSREYLFRELIRFVYVEIREDRGTYKRKFRIGQDCLKVKVDPFV